MITLKGLQHDMFIVHTFVALFHSFLYHSFFGFSSFSRTNTLSSSPALMLMKISDSLDVLSLLERVRCKPLFDDFAMYNCLYVGLIMNLTMLFLLESLDLLNRAPTTL
mmetsp:Transcript_22107/g.65555  ORF Transcript_22107/g.65555 Transcript_22107/m.65555 type:complete len:108 (+) Transcript_22107:57-380(+)